MNAVAYLRAAGIIGFDPLTILKIVIISGVQTNHKWGLDPIYELGEWVDDGWNFMGYVY